MISISITTTLRETILANWALSESSDVIKRAVKYLQGLILLTGLILSFLSLRGSMDSRYSTPAIVTTLNMLFFIVVFGIGAKSLPVAIKKGNRKRIAIYFDKQARSDPAAYPCLKHLTIDERGIGQHFLYPNRECFKGNT